VTAVCRNVFLHTVGTKHRLWKYFLFFVLFLFICYFYFVCELFLRELAGTCRMVAVCQRTLGKIRLLKDTLFLLKFASGHYV